MRRRLEDRVRELSAKVLVARGSELEVKLSELKAALQEHTKRLRDAAIVKLVRAEDGLPPERRSA